MMPFINLSDPFSILVAIVIFTLILFISRQMKRESIMIIMLGVFLAIIVGHTIELFTLDLSSEIISVIYKCIAMDFVFIFLSFISYLWIDSLEAEDRKTKSVDNSLNWLNKKV